MGGVKIINALPANQEVGFFPGRFCYFFNEMTGTGMIELVTHWTTFNDSNLLNMRRCLFLRPLKSA